MRPSGKPPFQYSRADVFPGGFSKPRVFFFRFRLTRSRVCVTYFSLSRSFTYPPFRYQSNEDGERGPGYTFSSAIIVFLDERVGAKGRRKVGKRNRGGGEREAKLISSEILKSGIPQVGCCLSNAADLTYHTAKSELHTFAYTRRTSE